MATAIQLGLVPGFALQDGDALAQLLGNQGGGFGLGQTVGAGWDLTMFGGAGTTQATAFPIVNSVTEIQVVTAANNSVILPPIQPTTMVRIYNDSATVMNIFPPIGQSIDGNPVNAPVHLSGHARCDYLAYGNGTWVSDLLGTISA